MGTSQTLPRELVHSIFSLSEPGPNATYLGRVCRQWRTVYEEFLYSSIAIYDNKTIKSTEYGCVNYTVLYYLKKDDQKHGVSIEKGGKYESWKQLGLLCRTLSENNNRLASHVREIDFCANISDGSIFSSITTLCRNVTHLCLRGAEDHEDTHTNASVKMAIKSLPSLQVLQSEGFFPRFSMSDIVSILDSCPKIRSLTVGLVGPLESESPPLAGDASTFRSSSPSHGTFSELRELSFLPLTPGKYRGDSISFPTYQDVFILSELSLPNLESFGAWIDDGVDSTVLIKKCLLAWAPRLKKLKLMGEGSSDDIAPHLSQLTDLTCSHFVFSESPILRMKTLQRFNMGAYLFFNDILKAIDIRQPEPALPRLTHVTAYIRDPASCSEEQRRLLSICRARKITVEQPAFESNQTRYRTHSSPYYYDSAENTSS